MVDPIKVAVIGAGTPEEDTGSAGWNMIKDLHADFTKDHYQLVGVARNTPLNVSTLDNAIRREFHSKLVITAKLEYIAGLSPDLAIICSPDDAHAQHMQYFLERGAHVLCEKPWTTNIADAERIAKLASQQKRIAAVATQNYGLGAFSAIRNILEDPAVEEIIAVVKFPGNGSHPLHNAGPHVLSELQLPINYDTGSTYKHDKNGQYISVHTAVPAFGDRKNVSLRMILAHNGVNGSNLGESLSEDHPFVTGKENKVYVKYADGRAVTIDFGRPNISQGYYRVMLAITEGLGETVYPHRNPREMMLNGLAKTINQIGEENPKTEDPYGIPLSGQFSTTYALHTVQTVEGLLALEPKKPPFHENIMGDPNFPFKRNPYENKD